MTGTRANTTHHIRKKCPYVWLKKNKSKLKKTFLLATTFSSLHVLGNIYPNQYFTHALILSSIQSYTTWYYNTTEWVHFWVSIIWYWISLPISFGKNWVIIIYYCYSNFHVNLINNLPISLLAFFANIFGEKWSNQNNW